MPNYVDPYGSSDTQVEVDRLRQEMRRFKRDPLRYGKIKVRNDGALVFPDDSSYFNEEGITFPDGSVFTDGMKWINSADSAEKAYVQGTPDIVDITALLLGVTAAGADEQVQVTLNADDANTAASMLIAVRLDGVTTTYRIEKGSFGLPSLTSDPSLPNDGSFWYRSDTDTLHLRANGVTETISTGGGGMDAVYKDSDETVNNSVTFQDDDELVLAVSANKVYRGHLIVFFDSGATPDIKFKFTIPTGAHIVWWNGGDNNLPPITSMQGTDLASDEDTLSGEGAGTTVEFAYSIVLFVASTAGNIQLQWAQDVQDGSDTKVLAGSLLALEEGDNAG